MESKEILTPKIFYTMKTSFNFYPPACPFVLAIPVLLLGLLSCDPVTPPIKETFSKPTIVDQYIGNYEMSRDNCHDGYYSIDISPDMPDVSFGPITPSKIHISNLMNTGRTPLVAEWDGAAFIFDNQHFTDGKAEVMISGRLYLSESDLTINYTLSDKVRPHLCTATFTRRI
jgi:hypothetical protein